VLECVSEQGKHVCKELGGRCHVERDGYYLVSGICVTFGLIFLVAFIMPTARKLQGWFLPQLQRVLNVHYSCFQRSPHPGGE
jgi:hypothetical protein